jgi:hypothetical protein
MTVTALELWIAAVTIAPMPTPKSRLSLILAKSFFNFPPLSDSKLALNIPQAIKNTPVPAIKDNIVFIVASIFISPPYHSVKLGHGASGVSPQPSWLHI